ncbi:MAG TPA: phosphatase PAP2 family protein [Steroidobacteraceae bacterium]|nr:phosphatase PAP2 family protein [Steroidobacteraceae bacterium]
MSERQRTWPRWLEQLKSQQLWPIVAVLLIAGAVWAFAEVADEVNEGEWLTFDRAILLSLREPTDLADLKGPIWLQHAARDITSLGGGTVLTLITAAAIGFLLLTRKFAPAILVAASVCGGAVLSSALKIAFARARPDIVPHVVEVYSASFPSGHAILATTTYLTLGTLLAEVQPNRRVKLYLLGWAVLLSFAIGVSRVYLGVHWPTDVLAGWCVGSAWALSCGLVALWVQRKRGGRALESETRGKRSRAGKPLAR